MRLKILLLLLALTATGALALYHGAIYETAKNLVEGVMVPYRVAKFVAEPAPETILMPVRGARMEDVTDTWGGARSEGRTHEGQDIFSEKGTPVNPAAEGYVVRIGENTLGGKIVVVLGRGSRGYYYAHLDSYGPDAAVGTLVSTTSVIGYVGTTGNATGTPPHLHFGLYTHEGPINPYPFLVDR